jgi:hypothetical protein
MLIQMDLLYIRVSIYAHLRKLSSVNSHLYASSIYAHIQKRAYTENAIMEVTNFNICVVCICVVCDVRICVVCDVCICVVCDVRICVVCDVCICVIYICAYMEVDIYKRCIYKRRYYGSG